MPMYLTVREAAARLGVSPVTIRRWTASGVLACNRTPGGHRRISTDDLDDMVRLIGDGDLIAARVAREREIDTLIATAVAMTSKLQQQDLLAEIARQITSVFDCTYCTISEYDPDHDTLRVLADFDRHGTHVPISGDPVAGVYHLSDFPLSRRVIDERIIATVDVDNPDDDPAERAFLVADNDASLLMAPLVYQGVSIGTLELIDVRPRTYSHQEQRLLRSMAALAAVSLMNARAFGAKIADEQQARSAHEPLETLAVSLPVALAQTEPLALLESVARALCDSFPALSCVASMNGHSAGAAGKAAVPETSSTDAVMVVGRDRSGLTDLTLTVAFPAAEYPYMNGMLDLVAGTASAMASQMTAHGTIASP